MNGASGFDEARPSTSRSFTCWFLHEQRHRFGSGAWHFFRTEDCVVLITGTKTKRDKIPAMLFRVRMIAISLLTLALFSLSSCTKVEVFVSGGKHQGHLKCNPKHLSFGMIGEDQETDTWCWATSAKSILAYYGYGEIPQCELVAKVRNSPATSCCDPPEATTVASTSAEVAAFEKYVNICLNGGMPHEIFEFYTIQYDRTPPHNSLTWNSLQHQLCEFGPFIFIVEWLGGGLHTGVLEGYHTTNIPTYKQWVELDDHGHTGFFLKPFDEFVYDPTEHVHYGDYINFRHGS